MYDPAVEGQVLEFGISGWLYQSSLVLYDTASLGLWTQVDGRAIGGKYRDTILTKVAAADTSWGVWKAAHPDTLVLSDETGYDRPYTHNPYAAGNQADPNAKPLYPVMHEDGRLPYKVDVYGVEVAGAAKAYPLAALPDTPATFTDRVAGRAITVTYDPAGPRFTVRDAAGADLPVHRLYWFALAAFHPATDIFTPQAHDAK